jgi:hypothetical protein
MAVSLSFPHALYVDLVNHLRAAREEQVTFGFATSFGKDTLQVTELFHVPASRFEVQSEYHVLLADDVRADVIHRASELESSLIEAHSHSSRYPASFSPTDLIGLEEWVPHVRWRLRGKPYVALVFGGTTFDALVWEDKGEVSPLKELATDGTSALRPTGLTYRSLSEAV